MTSPRFKTINLLALGKDMTMPWPADHCGAPPSRIDDVEVSRDGWTALRFIDCGNKKIARPLFTILGAKAWASVWDGLGLECSAVMRGESGLRLLALMSLYRWEQQASRWLCALVDGTEGWESMKRICPDVASHPDLIAWKQSIESRKTPSGKAKKPSAKGRPRGSANGKRRELLLAAIGVYDLAKIHDRPISQVEAVQRAQLRWPNLARAANLDPESLKKEFRKLRLDANRAGLPRRT